MDASQRVAANVRRLREEAGWTQAEFARRLGWPPGNVSRLESGRRDVSVSTLAHVAEVLGVDPGVLVTTGDGL